MVAAPRSRAVTGLRAGLGAGSRAPAAVAVPLGTALVLGAAAGSNGTYFPTSWGLLALLLGWLAAAGLIVRREVAFTRLELVVLGALTAFVGWVALSMTWSQDVPATVLEVERDLLYPLALLAVLLFARARQHVALLGGLATGITAVCAYGLATRLFPGRFDVFDPSAPISGYRLGEPLGYWNGLAIFAVMGVLLALGFATESRLGAIRALAGASLVILLPTLYFTFSRGGWLCLGIGVAAAFAFSPRRLRFATLALLMAPAPAIAVVVASRLDGLTTPAAFAHAARDGHRLAVVLVVLGGIAAATAAGIGMIERRLHAPAAARRGWATVLALVVLGSLVFVSVRYGSPPTLARKAYRSFQGAGVEVKTGESLQKRLFSLSSSGRLDHWRVAWRDYAAHPVLGSGAGSYEQQWTQHRPFPGKVRDAHNLYMEVLAELGPVGLALLLAALGVALAAALRTRHEPIVPVAVGAYGAYVVHAGVDWDWEMVAVTLAALGIAGSMFVAARHPNRQFALSFRARIGLLAAVAGTLAFATVGLLGNFPLRQSASALKAKRWEAAAVDARRAIRWQPWAGEPLKNLGRAQRKLGELGAARRSFREAVDRDPGDWRAWFFLGKVTQGAEQRHAYEQAARLNPFAADVQLLCRVRYLPPALCRKPPSR